jgi:hypothetical protein
MAAIYIIVLVGPSSSGVVEIKHASFFACVINRRSIQLVSGLCFVVEMLTHRAIHLGMSPETSSVSHRPETRHT